MFQLIFAFGVAKYMLLIFAFWDSSIYVIRVSKYENIPTY